MATRAHLKSEIESIDRQIAAHGENLATHLARHNESVGRLHARKAHLDHAHSLLGDDAESGQGTAEQSRDTLTQDTSAQGGQGNAGEVGQVLANGAGTTLPEEPMVPAPKSPRTPRAKGKRQGKAVEAKADAKPEAKARGRRKGAQAKAAEAKPEAKSDVKAEAAPSEAAAQAKPARKRVRDRSRAAREAKLAAKADQAAPAQANAGEGQASATKQNPLTLKALDTLRHAGRPMNSGEIAREIGVAARGMGPIMSPLTTSGEVNRTNKGDVITYSLPAQAAAEGATAH